MKDLIICPEDYKAELGGLLDSCLAAEKTEVFPSLINECKPEDGEPYTFNPFLLFIQYHSNTGVANLLHYMRHFVQL